MYSSKEFLALKKEWYEKLRLSGFKDQEFHYRDGNTTFALVSESFSSLRAAYKPQTVFYFQKAGWYLYHGWFYNHREQKIWQGHCEGRTHREMAEELGMKRQNVTVIVKRVRKRMIADKRYEQEEAKQIARITRRFNFVVDKVAKK